MYNLIFCLVAVDTPDPYVVVHIRAAPDGRKRTKHKDNDPNPIWEEELNYLLPTKVDHNVIAEVSRNESKASLYTELYIKLPNCICTR